MLMVFKAIYQVVLVELLKVRMDLYGDILPNELRQEFLLRLVHLVIKHPE